MKKMVRVLGIGIIVLAFVSILPAEGISLEKREELAYVETAQLNLPLGRRWPVLKLDSLSSVSDTYQQDMELVKKLETLIKDVDPEHKFGRGQRKEKWTNTFRLMRERDDCTMEDIQAIMDFAFHDSFWSAVIQSAESLRKNYNQLRAKMLKGKSNEEKPKRPKPAYINYSTARTITL